VTLDEAYGVGRSITADAGSVDIQGGSGTLLEVDTNNTGGNAAEVHGGALSAVRTNTSPASLRFRASSRIWLYEFDPTTNVFAIRDEAGSTYPVKVHGNGRNNTLVIRNGRVGIRTLEPAGTLDVNGPIYQRGASLHADYVFSPDYQLPSIREHAQAMWHARHLPAVPPVETDERGREVIELGAHHRGLLEELELAHVFIAELHQRLRRAATRTRGLEARLTQLHQTAERLELLADGVQAAVERDARRHSRAQHL
jgi:hypothetical protein